MDGLTVGVGHGKIDDSSSVDTEKQSLAFAKYASWFSYIRSTNG